MSALGKAGFASIGLVLGMGLGLLVQREPVWVGQHLGLLLLAGIGLMIAAFAYVSRGMAIAERGHDQRAEAFRLVMLAQFAPELLDRELAS